MTFDRRRFLLLFALGAAGASGPAWARRADDLPFSLDLPPGFTVEARPRGPDFDVYDVMKGQVGYVGIYVGNFASFPMQANAKVKPGAAPNIQVAEGVGADGSPRREYLITNKGGWPGTLHVWTQNPPGDQATAERIAASVRLK